MTTPGGSLGRDRRSRMEEIFAGAVELPPAERLAFLADACADDPALRAELDALLASHDALNDAASEGRGFLQALDPSRASALLRDAGPEQEEGTIIGRYRIVRRLGRGGMGVVYLARDPALDRPVALKVLSPHLSADATAERRFIEEARAASALDHAHIATVYEIGETEDGRLYIAMAYYEGETLRQRIARGPLPIDDAVELAAQVASGLAAAHGKDIVHRDIKPENLVQAPPAGLKIVDFGVAKVAAEALTRTGATVGTVAYMSPEQSAGDRIDGRTDVWSLGVVLYEMLTGTKPFRGPTAAVIYAIRNDDPVPVRNLRPEVPAPVAAIVDRCLEKDPARRFASAADLCAALRGVDTATAGGAIATGSGHPPAPSHGGTMGRVRDLILDVHRRSLWQVLAVYIAASWFVLQASDHLVDRYLLPEWVYGFAVVLLLVGLPIVLATAMVREEPLPTGFQARPRSDRRTQAGAPTGAGQPAAHASSMGSVLTWPRALAGGAMAFMTLALLSGFIVLRGVPRVAEATGSAGSAFPERGWIVVADFESDDEDAGVARALREALTVDLQQSAHINVHGQSTIAGILRRMDIPATTPLDLPLALDVAERAGAGAVLTARVSRLGGQYVLSGRVLETGSGNEMFAVRAAAGEARLLEGVETFSREVRRRLGEERNAIRQSRPLPDVTTRSLDALRLYADAEHALTFLANERAGALARQAIRIDPGFAMAHRLAGVSASNLLQWGEAQRHTVNAYELRDRLTDRERWHVEGFYYATVALEPRLAADAFELILDRYPDDVRAATNLGVMHTNWLGDREGAYHLGERARALNTGGYLQLDNLGTAAFLSGRVAEADSLYGIAEAEGHHALVWKWRVSRSFALARPGVTALCDSVLSAPPPVGWPGDREYCGSVDLASGRLRSGIERLEDVAREHSERGRLHPMANVVGGIVAGHAMRGDHDQAAARIDALLADVPAEAIPELDRLIIRTNLRVGAALLNRPDLVERIGAAYPPYHDPDHWFSRMGEALVSAAVAVAEGDGEAALDVLRAETKPDRQPFGWIFWNRLLWGLAYETVNQPDSAVVHYRRATDPGLLAESAGAFSSRVFLPFTLRRLAEASEASSDPEAAIGAYQRLLDLRSDADPELSDEVSAVRAAVARLGEPRS